MGSILSFSWIYNEELRKLVEQKWSKYVTDRVMKDWPRFAMVNNDHGWRDLKGPQQPPGGQKIGFKSSLIQFVSDGPFSFIIGPAGGKQKRYRHMDFSDVCNFRFIILAMRGCE